MADKNQAKTKEEMGFGKRTNSNSGRGLKMTNPGDNPQPSPKRGVKVQIDPPSQNMNKGGGGGATTDAPQQASTGPNTQNSNNLKPPKARKSNKLSPQRHTIDNPKDIKDRQGFLDFDLGSFQSMEDPKSIEAISEVYDGLGKIDNGTTREERLRQAQIILR